MNSIAFRRPIVLFAFLLLVAATGCTASLQPLSDKNTSQPDVSLLGTWQVIVVGEKQNSPLCNADVHRKKDEANVLQIETVNDKGEKTIYDVFCTKVGDASFASMEREQEGKKYYLLYKYVSDGGTLKVWPLDNAFFIHAVQQKELKGTVKSDLVQQAVLDDTPENLRSFLQKYGDKCFSADTFLLATQTKKEN